MNMCNIHLRQFLFSDVVVVVAVLSFSSAETRITSLVLCLSWAIKVLPWLLLPHHTYHSILPFLSLIITVKEERKTGKMMQLCKILCSFSTFSYEYIDSYNFCGITLLWQLLSKKWNEKGVKKGSLMLLLLQKMISPKTTMARLDFFFNPTLALESQNNSKEQNSKVSSYVFLYRATPLAGKLHFFLKLLFSPSTYSSIYSCVYMLT